MKLSRLIIGALIALLLAAPLTSGMLVLCIGSDGHVALESAGPNLCCSEWEAAHQETPDEGLPTTIVPASESCCSDIELSVAPATLSLCSQRVLAASALPCSVPTIESPQRTTSADIHPLPTESPVAASLRTVVLRT